MTYQSISRRPRPDHWLAEDKGWGQEQHEPNGWDTRDYLLETRLDVVDFGAISHPRPADLQRSNVEVYARFADLKQDWLLGTQTLSSVQEIVLHPAYQQIIGLGPQVVPFIIDELRSGPEHWFWALASIVGEDHAVGAETLREAAGMWVDWFERSR